MSALAKSHPLHRLPGVKRDLEMVPGLTDCPSGKAWNAKMGDRSGADQLYLEAEDEITVKEMRSYAWVELQRGVLDFPDQSAP